MWEWRLKLYLLSQLTRDVFLQLPTFSVFMYSSHSYIPYTVTLNRAKWSKIVKLPSLAKLVITTPRQKPCVCHRQRKHTYQLLWCDGNLWGKTAGEAATGRESWQNVPHKTGISLRDNTGRGIKEIGDGHMSTFYHMQHISSASTWRATVHVSEVLGIRTQCTTLCE